MIAVLAAGAAFGTVVVFLLALGGRDTAAIARLEGLRRTPASTGAEAKLTSKQRVLEPIADALVQAMKRTLPARMLGSIEHKLVLAGGPMTLNGFLLFHLITTGTFLLLPVLVVVGSGASFGLLQLVVVLLFIFIGFYLPHMWLNQRASQRTNQIVKSLPDSFDLITTCVEAGLGLDAALARVAEKVEGPFADELLRFQREVALGKARREALRELADRSGANDLVAFVNALIQAEQLGSSVGTVLRVQADQLRVRRRQRAEEQAYKAPIKMLFPLVLCIFPTLFIVILGPAIITIMTEFPGG